VLGGIAVGAALGAAPLVGLGQRKLGLAPGIGHALVVGLTLLLFVPFAVGAFRTSRRLAATLATLALPSGQGGLDLAVAPRRALPKSLRSWTPRAMAR
jgi:hypothetical protein